MLLDGLQRKIQVCCTCRHLHGVEAFTARTALRKYDQPTAKSGTTNCEKRRLYRRGILVQTRPALGGRRLTSAHPKRSAQASALGAHAEEDPRDRRNARLRMDRVRRDELYVSYRSRRLTRRLYRNPKTIQKSRDYTETRRLYRNPKTLQKS